MLLDLAPGRELRDVVLEPMRPSSSPPQKAKRTRLSGSIPRSAICDGGFEHRRGSRAVVVDAGPFRDRVEVRTDDDGSIVAPGRGVGDHVLGRRRGRSRPRAWTASGADERLADRRSCVRAIRGNRRSGGSRVPKTTPNRSSPGTSLPWLKHDRHSHRSAAPRCRPSHGTCTCRAARARCCPRGTSRSRSPRSRWSIARSPARLTSTAWSVAVMSPDPE